MEVKMKKYMLVCFLMLLMLAVVLPVGLFSQPEDEGEEDPVQTMPNPLAWKQLEKMDNLKTLKITEVRKGQVWQFDLMNIKLALEKAKINQKVTILYVNAEGVAYPLGTYSPLKRKAPGSMKSPTAKEKLKKRLINPQPEPPKWLGIPSVIQVSDSMALKMTDIRWKGKSVLIFKDASGQIKAVANLSQTGVNPLKVR
jgi:hypothetical protein